MDSILSSTEEELKLAQAKITYLGEQNKPIPTVVFFTGNHEMSMESFVKFQKDSQAYSNDDLPYTKHVSVTAREFRRMLSAVQPTLTREAVPKGHELLSFCVVREIAGKVEGCEFRIGSALGREFYRNLLDALGPGNEPARAALSKQLMNIFP
jgi:hypothetical protein